MGWKVEPMPEIDACFIPWNICKYIQKGAHTRPSIVHDSGAFGEATIKTLRFQRKTRCNPNKCKDKRIVQQIQLFSSLRIFMQKNLFLSGWHWPPSGSDHSTRSERFQSLETGRTYTIKTVFLEFDNSACGISFLRVFHLCKTSECRYSGCCGRQEPSNICFRRKWKESWRNTWPTKSKAPHKWLPVKFPRNYFLACSSWILIPLQVRRWSSHRSAGETSREILLRRGRKRFEYFP